VEAFAYVPLIVWRRDWDHRVEADPAEIAGDRASATVSLAKQIQMYGSKAA
jgi:hypothetical protein